MEDDEIGQVQIRIRDIVTAWSRGDDRSTSKSTPAADAANRTGAVGEAASFHRTAAAARGTSRAGAPPPSVRLRTRESRHAPRANTLQSRLTGTMDHLLTSQTRARRKAGDDTEHQPHLLDEERMERRRRDGGSSRGHESAAASHRSKRVHTVVVNENV